MVANIIAVKIGPLWLLWALKLYSKNESRGNKNIIKQLGHTKINPEAFVVNYTIEGTKIEMPKLRYLDM